VFFQFNLGINKFAWTFIKCLFFCLELIKKYKKLKNMFENKMEQESLNNTESSGILNYLKNGKYKLIKSENINIKNYFIFHFHISIKFTFTFFS
jgi:hypothetical protein